QRSAGREGFLGLPLEYPVARPCRQHRASRRAKPLVVDLSARANELEPDDAVLLWRRTARPRRVNSPRRFERGNRSITHRERRLTPVLDAEAPVNDVGRPRFDVENVRAREPSERIDPVDALVDERAAWHAIRIDEPAGRPRAIPVFRDRPAARLVDDGEIPNVARIEARLEVREPQTHAPLERKPADARGFHSVHHSN